MGFYLSGATGGIKNVISGDHILKKKDIFYKMELYKNKTIILAVPDHFGLPVCFRKNLELLGFTVYSVPHDASKKIRISHINSFIHFLKKIFLKDKSYKTEKLTVLKEKPQLEILSNIRQSDFALVIRPDLFSESVLKEIKNKSKFSVAYQWDGMKRFPLAETRVQFFDRFFVFDKNDEEKYQGVEFTTNFYFDYLPEFSIIKQDVFFVGTFMKDRIEDIAFIASELQHLGLNININIVYNNEKKIEKYRKYPINFIKKGLTFEESMIECKSSEIVLDVENKIHAGLSFRAFEAVGYKRKLITNNKLVKEFDFYNERNIYIINESSMSLEQFLE